MCVLIAATAPLRRRRETCAWSSRSASEASSAGVAAQRSQHSHPQPQQTCPAVHEISAAGDPAASETP